MTCDGIEKTSEMKKMSEKGGLCGGITGEHHHPLRSNTTTHSFSRAGEGLWKSCWSRYEELKAP
jgi:hypothetical protein